MSELNESPSRPDFNWVRKKVSDSLVDDEVTKRQWDAMVNWLDDQGETYLRKQVEILTQDIKTQALALLSDLKNKIPEE
ncbi:MAG: hypothetical protein ACRECH_07990 [Nitrososphaerales archaeon]